MCVCVCTHTHELLVHAPPQVATAAGRFVCPVKENKTHRDFIHGKEGVLLAVAHPWASASSYLSSQSLADSRSNLQSTSRSSHSLLCSVASSSVSSVTLSSASFCDDAAACRSLALAASPASRRNSAKKTRKKGGMGGRHAATRKKERKQTVSANFWGRAARRVPTFERDF